uniref:Viral late gene transcription factor 3 zinc ribbon domain-containing protein n=1 Tax=viral metagenome TaxID=1070528 RepID=A0A6C0E3P8_9ZZZZ
MPSFKPKLEKKIFIDKKISTTLDGKHSEFVDQFQYDEENIIPKLKNEKIKLQQKLTNLQKNNDSDLTIEEIMDIKDKIKEIQDKIKKIKEKRKTYYLDNSKYIFDYFENKKNISNDVLTDGNYGSDVNNSIHEISLTKKKSVLITTEKTKKLENFFKIKNSVNITNENNNNNIVKKYLSNVDDSFIDVNHFVHNSDICKFCYKGELIPLDDEGILICNVCFKNVPYLIENEKPSYKEPPKEVCFYAYKRINHFKEIIAQFQGKETTQIPPEVIGNIKHQIKKERIKITQITNAKTKEILKKLGYNKYYEHIPFIKDKLGIKPPVMSPELEDKLFNLFMELQSPYSKFCPDDRVNFLNYYYTAYKLCELLKENQYLEHFPMLKDREKRIEQDNIWKKICGELDWEFIPTI